MNTQANLLEIVVNVIDTMDQPFTQKAVGDCVAESATDGQVRYAMERLEHAGLITQDGQVGHGTKRIRKTWRRSDKWGEKLDYKCNSVERRYAEFITTGEVLHG